MHRVSTFSATRFFEWHESHQLRLKYAVREGRFMPQLGSQSTRFAGQSLEFFDYAPYSSGDDTRFLSTRFFARTHHWFVRRMHHFSPRKILFYLDGSASMFFPEPERTRSWLDQKWSRQCAIALTLAHEFIMRGDWCEFIWDTEQGGVVRLIKTRKSWREVVTSIEKAFSSDQNHLNQGQWSQKRILNSTASSVLFFSDFLESDDLKMASVLVQKKIRECAIIVVRHAEEQMGPHEVPYRFYNCENATQEVDVARVDMDFFREHRDAQDHLINELCRRISSQCPTQRIATYSMEDLLKCCRQILRGGRT